MNTQAEAVALGPKTAAALALGQRIQEARGATIRREVAIQVGVHENTFGKWERGETVPDVLQLQAIARALNRSIGYFLAEGQAVEDHAAGQAAGEALRSTRVTRRGEYLHVPLFDLRTSRQLASLTDIEQVREMVPFSTRYVASEIGIQHDDLAVVQMFGTTGEPDIRSGDIVLVDLRDRQVSAEGAHLVRVDDAMVIKTLRRKPGRIVVSNGWAEAGAFEVPLDSSSSDFEVLGRCRWVGHPLG